ncbi:MAG: hypothetical protein C0494_06785 [Sphingobium sp.]|nr:hypothetical protein [Sphingobium sp.]
MRHTAAGTADINVFDFVGVLRYLESIFLEEHREPGAPALDRVVVQMFGEEAIEVATGRHHQLAIYLPLRGVFRKRDLACLFGRNMAEVFAMPGLIPRFIMPGCR